MSRSTGYRFKPDENWQKLYEELMATTFFLVARSGPCVFTIKDDSGSSFKIILGNPHKCSCSKRQQSQILSSTESGIQLANVSTSTAVNKSSLCIHVLFCLIKILKVDIKNPLSYQDSLLDSELEQLLNSSSRSLVSRLRNSNAIVPIDSTEAVASTESANNASEVQRQPLVYDSGQGSDPGEHLLPVSCPICQDDIIAGQSLTWCRKGCGNNIHSKCMYTYTQYNISKNATPLCPFCRESFDMDCLRMDCKVHSSKSKFSCASIACQSCTLKTQGLFYRCIECSQQRSYHLFDNVVESPKKLPRISQSAISTNRFEERPSPCALNPSNMKAIKRTVDYCQPCFKRVFKGHTGHHFLQSDASAMTTEEVVWVVVNNPCDPPKILADLSLLRLQDRELTTNDYEMLLGLDRSERPQLPEHVVAALPAPLATHNFEASGCWCGSGIGEASEYRLLRCDHVAHTRCISEIIFEAGNDLVSVEKIVCKHSNCDKTIFRGLSRRRMEKKKVALDYKPPDTAPTVSSSSDFLATFDASVKGMRLDQFQSSTPQNVSMSSSLSHKRQGRQPKLRALMSKTHQPHHEIESDSISLIGTSNFSVMCLTPVAENSSSGAVTVRRRPQIIRNSSMRKLGASAATEADNDLPALLTISYKTHLPFEGIGESSFQEEATAASKRIRPSIAEMKAQRRFYRSTLRRALEADSSKVDESSIALVVLPSLRNRRSHVSNITDS